MDEFLKTPKDFTPTTEMIRGNLVYWLSTYTPSKEEDIEGQFDRWLRQHDVDIVNETKTYIIKLLTDTVTDKGKELNPMHCEWCLFTKMLIEKIKNA